MVSIFVIPRCFDFFYPFQGRKSFNNNVSSMGFGSSIALGGLVLEIFV